MVQVAEFLSEEDCSSETAKKARGDENVCVLLGSGYSKQEGAYTIVDILVRCVLPNREEPSQAANT